MKYGAQPSDKISAAPVGIVRWNVTLRGVPMSPIEAHSWFEARDKAMALHRCDWVDLDIHQAGSL